MMEVFLSESDKAGCMRCVTIHDVCSNILNIIRVGFLVVFFGLGSSLSSPSIRQVRMHVYMYLYELCFSELNLIPNSV